MQTVVHTGSRGYGILFKADVTDGKALVKIGVEFSRDEKNITRWIIN